MKKNLSLNTEISLMKTSLAQAKSQINMLTLNNGKLGKVIQVSLETNLAQPSSCSLATMTGSSEGLRSR
jgi:hypothetical protein